MSWLTDDPDVLNFVLDAVDTWNESDVETTSSDELSEATPTKETADMKLSFGDELKKKRRNRTNRRQEILELRAQASSLTNTLERLQHHHKATPELASSLAKWEQQARRELSSRRQAELKNVWLRATLARHVKITRRLSRLLHQLKSTPLAPPMFDFDGRVLEAPSETIKEESPVVAMAIHDLSPSDAVVIEITGVWQFQGRCPASLETAIWTLFSADHLRVTQFAIDYEIVSSDNTSVHASFTIHSNDGAEFQGRQRAQCRRDELSGELVVSVTSQTLPLGVHHSDVFADATLLEEESQFRVRNERTGSSQGASTLVLERRFRLHAAHASGDHRLEIARTIGFHLQTEMQWMHDEVERRAGQSTDDTSLLFPVQETPEDARSLEREQVYVL